MNKEQYEFWMPILGLPICIFLALATVNDWFMEDSVAMLVISLLIITIFIQVSKIILIPKEQRQNWTSESNGGTQ